MSLASLKGSFLTKALGTVVALGITFSTVATADNAPSSTAKYTATPSTQLFSSAANENKLIQKCADVTEMLADAPLSTDEERRASIRLAEKNGMEIEPYYQAKVTDRSTDHITQIRSKGEFKPAQMYVRTFVDNLQVRGYIARMYNKYEACHRAYYEQKMGFSVPDNIHFPLGVVLEVRPDTLLQVGFYVDARGIMDKAHPEGVYTPNEAEKIIGYVAKAQFKQDDYYSRKRVFASSAPSME
jgi:hypothetical protein